MTINSVCVALLFALTTLFFRADVPSNANTLISPTPTPTPTAETIDTWQRPDGLLGFEKEPSFEDYLNGGLGSVDADCDGIRNIDDNCALSYNPRQKDTDQDGHGDACDRHPRKKAKPHSDTEGSNKMDERCDMDSDGVFDRSDNCILVCNPNQRDKDKDGIGDACQAQGGISKFCPKKPR